MLTITGNVLGPDGIYKTFADLAPGEPFVYSLADVTPGAILFKTAVAGKAYRVSDGALIDSGATDTVIAVNVAATVTV